MLTRLTNTTASLISLNSGHKIPAKGYVDVEPATMAKANNDPHFAMVLRTKQLEATPLSDPDEVAPPSPELTRAGVAKMKKSELVDHLMSLSEGGADDKKIMADMNSQTADDLRAALVQLVFVDL